VRTTFTNRSQRLTLSDYSASFTLARRRDRSRAAVQVKNREIFPIPISFSALARDDPFRIHGKALRILKLVFRVTVKIW